MTTIVHVLFLVNDAVMHIQAQIHLTIAFVIAFFSFFLNGTSIIEVKAFTVVTAVLVI